MEFFSLGILDNVHDGGEGLLGDALDLAVKVLPLVALDGAQHVHGPLVEVGLDVQLLVGEEVDERSLLHEIVLLVDSAVFELLLGFAQMVKLRFFAGVRPLTAKLLSLVVRVNGIPNSELGSEEVGKMSRLGVAQVHADKILVMPNHRSEPFVVAPAAHP